MSDQVPAASRGHSLVLRTVVVIGLAIDAYVHFKLAPNFDELKGTGALAVSQGLLFRVEAVAAILATVLVVVWRVRATAMLAFAVAAGGVVAVLLYHYFEIGPIGPLPDMHDPTWTPEKVISLIAEAVAAVAALVLVFQPARREVPVA